MLVPLDWMPALHALALLGVGAAVLAVLLVQALRKTHHPWLTSLLAVIGLFLIAAALEVLKDHTPFLGPVRSNPHFVIVRNAESLALVLLPLTLATLRHPRLARALAGVLGLLGIGLLVVLGRAGVAGWSLEGPIRITATWIPGATLLAGTGHIEAGRWLWCAGSALIALPTVRATVRRLRRRIVASDPALDFVLPGLALSAAAMAVFFWHQVDWADREYARVSLPLIAYAALLLTLGEGRVASARWAQHALGGLGAMIALWMLTGARGLITASGEFFAAQWLAILQIILLSAVPLALAFHLALRAALSTPGGRRSAHRRSEGPPHLE